MEDSKKIDLYISNHEKWQEQLSTLRKLFLKSELTEEVKWGAPAYTYNGSIVSGLGGFKNHYAIWFHQGVFLKDKEKQLTNAQDRKTKAMRQWKFSEDDVIDQILVFKYIQEATENAKAGKKVKPQKKKALEVPNLLKEALEKQNELKKAFSSLSPGKQREYAEHIGSAKKEATQQSRLEKAIPMILSGKGLYDKYKNC